ncbi:MAG: type II secretion system protein [Anaerolineae bacterium]
MGRSGAADEKGFSLIELLITVAIIGILAAIATPSLIAGQQRARYATAAADTRQIVTQALVLTNDNNQVADAVCGNPMPRCLWDGSAPSNLLYMSIVNDPWAPAGATYLWNQAPGPGCGAATPGCVVYASWTIGANGADDNGAAWLGQAAPLTDDLGNSSLVGCAFGPMVPVASPC